MAPTVIGEFLAINALCNARAVKEDVGDTHHNVVDNATSGDEVDQPGQDFAGSAGKLQEREEREDHNDAEAVDRNAIPCRLSEETWGSAFESHTVKVTHRGVGVSVASGEYRRQHEGIGDVRENSDAEVVPVRLRG